MPAKTFQGPPQLRPALAWALVATGAALVSACGGSSLQDESAQAAKSYLVALAEGDGARACGRLTGPAKRRLAETAGEAASCEEAVERIGGLLSDDEREAVKEADVADVRVEGNTAAVAFEGAPIPLELVRGESGWRVSGGLGADGAPPLLASGEVTRAEAVKVAQEEMEAFSQVVSAQVIRGAGPDELLWAVKLGSISTGELVVVRVDAETGAVVGTVAAGSRESSVTADVLAGRLFAYDVQEVAVSETLVPRPQAQFQVLIGAGRVDIYLFDSSQAAEEAVPELVSAADLAEQLDVEVVETRVYVATSESENPNALQRFPSVVSAAEGG